MFQFVRCSRYAIVASLLISLIIDRIYCSNTTSKQKGGIDVFDLLLGLYKINPLKGSKVYTKFANNVLTHNAKRSLPFKAELSSSENANSQKVTLQELTDIEKVLHPLYKQQIRHSMEKPEYDVENVDPENFNIDIILQDNLETGYRGTDKSSNKNFLEGIDVSGLENILPNYVENTKLIPSHQWLLPTSIKRDPAPVRQWLTKFEGYGNDEQHSQIPNKVQEPPVINTNILTPDVVVL